MVRSVSDAKAIKTNHSRWRDHLTARDGPVPRLGACAVSGREVEGKAPVLCSDCDKPPVLCSDCSDQCHDGCEEARCTGCGVFEGATASGLHCLGCAREWVESEMGLPYPAYGVRGSTLPDRLLAFMQAVELTCCGMAAARPCDKCKDAAELRKLYVSSLNEVRT